MVFQHGDDFSTQKTDGRNSEYTIKPTENGAFRMVDALRLLQNGTDTYQGRGPHPDTG